MSGSLDGQVAIVTGSAQGIGHAIAQGLATEGARIVVADPALETHPGNVSVLGAAASVAYHRGDYALADRLAHRGLELAADAEGSRLCLTALSLADNSR